ncbi:MAG: protein kinase [Myxococcota bacterium]|nr:protein kinase [Myxococcota bacterium]
MRVCTQCGRTTDATGDCPSCHGSLITMTRLEVDGNAALAAQPEEELIAGTKVGDYEIEKLIGSGGMGNVYGAVHPLIGKRAAIKVLNARFCADHEAVRRFVREAQAVNKIGHANIVDIFSMGDLPDNRAYLVMEWLHGETLMDRLERAPLPVEHTVAILISLTRALEAAHAAGVVHRDLKPENVFLVPEDESFRVKLLDFGIAKLETRRAPTRKTATGMTVGTPLYMSPEQAKGIAIDGKSDVYSLGVLAYAMVCRTTPFEDEASPVEVLHAHISKTPKPPHKHVKDVPPALDNLILQMLEKLPEDRPAMPEIRRRLKALDGGGFETFTGETRWPITPMSGTPKLPAKRARWPIAVGIAAVVIGSGVFMIVRAKTAEEAKPVVVAPKVEPPPAPPAAPAKGTLELVVEPSTATVLVDGEPVVLAKGRAKLELPVGDHAIATNATGYRATEQSVAVTSETVTPVAIKLAKQQRNGGARPRPRPTKDVDAVVDPFNKKKPR